LVYCWVIHFKWRHEGSKGSSCNSWRLCCSLQVKETNVNTRSSTETELIAVDDALPTIQWITNFMKAQGYHLDTEIKEDNKSTMLLMKNGKLSSGKRTKHFDIRYFYIKNLIDRGIINLIHCISDDMLADFFTKPIQGKRFQILRDLILNINSATVHRSVLVNINSTYALPQNSPSVTQTQTVQTVHSLDLTKIERGRDRDNNWRYARFKRERVIC